MGYDEDYERDRVESELEARIKKLEAEIKMLTSSETPTEPEMQPHQHWAYRAALDAVLALPIWNALLLELPAAIVNDAKQEVEKLRKEATSAK